MTRTSGPLNEDQKIPARGIYTEAARLERLEWLKARTGDPDLSALAVTRLSPERLTGNIENLIGAIEVPVGLAGPLHFNGEHAIGPIYAPFATSEGALVASATRGATAITRSGGVTTRVVAQRMMRVPLFTLSNIHGAARFCAWMRDHMDAIRAQVATVSRHANLLSCLPNMLGKMVHVTFLYETGDAAGQNMTTSCTWQACQWIMTQFKDDPTVVFENFLIEANVSGDKKVTYKSFMAGRGIRAVAECVIDREVCRQVLKTTPEAMAATYTSMIAGSIQVGMVGFNVNVANVLGGIFPATGQDMACIHECSLGQLSISVADGDLYASMVMPALIVGTVGGGTHLPAQKALLQMMGCYGLGKVPRLAEIIVGYSLALDISTMAALATGEFASAHEKLGRSRLVRWLQKEELTAPFFEPALQRALGDAALRLETITADSLEMGSSIITELTARKVNKLVGHFPFDFRYRTGDGAEHSAAVVVKVKPLDEEVVLMINSIAQMCGGLLASAHSKHRHRTGFVGCHTRELALYEERDPRFTRIAPKVYGTIRDDEREMYVVVMEKLDDTVLMNSADNPSGWTREHIEAALRGIGTFHGIWYGREEELKAQPWLGPYPTVESMTDMRDLWDALMVHGSEEFPELVSEDELELMRDLVKALPDWWTNIEQMPRTLIHNDFNPRNICFRVPPPVTTNTDGQPQSRASYELVAYDWELATLHLPQHDLAELLCFVLPDNTTSADVDHYLDVHRQALMASSGRHIDWHEWREGYRFALRDFCVNRVCLYLMAHTARRYRFMRRVVRSARTLLLLEL